MSQPLVSIVIANFNYGRFLDEAIGSALSQNHLDREIIVVDDGSHDESLSVARKYPVMLIEQQNQGVCAARNRGAAAAKGDYILFLDADDILEPAHVAACVAALERSPRKVAYAYTGVRYFGNETGILEGRPFDPDALIEGNFVHASALIRRDIFQSVGGFSLAWNDGVEDYELWIRMLNQGYEGLLVDGPLLGYRRHGHSRSSLNGETHKAIRWRMRFKYPRLFWRKLAKDPLRTFFFLIKFWTRRLGSSPRP